MQLESSTVAKFWARVDKSGDCWLWTGFVHPKGYGYMPCHVPPFKITRAHRFSWMLHFGEIPVGLFVLHHCDVRHCVRPSHLFVGTNADNMADMAAKGRGRSGDHRGERHTMAKLTDEKVRLIRALYAAGGTTTYQLAKQFGVNAESTRRIIKRERWKHVV